MLLTDRQIQSKALLDQAVPESYRGSTYYLRIGQIIPIDDPSHPPTRSHEVKAHELGPQEMAWIVSEENFSLSADVTGFATLVTRLTKRGLLGLNVGVIDPTFHGPIGTVVVNFSKEKQILRVGDEFFRIMFFSHDRPEHLPFPADEKQEKSPAFYAKKRKEYTADAQERALNKLPRSFLNVQELVGNIWQDGIRKYSTQLAVYAALLAFIVALAQVTLGMIGVAVAKIYEAFGY